MFFFLTLCDYTVHTDAQFVSGRLTIKKFVYVIERRDLIAIEIQVTRKNGKFHKKVIHFTYHLK